MQSTLYQEIGISNYLLYDACPVVDAAYNMSDEGNKIVIVSTLAPILQTNLREPSVFAHKLINLKHKSRFQEYM